MLEDVLRDQPINPTKSLALFRRDDKYIVAVVETCKDPVVTTHEDPFTSQTDAEQRYFYRAAFNGRRAFETKN